jgi:hypothetical protein
MWPWHHLAVATRPCKCLRSTIGCFIYIQNCRKEKWHETTKILLVGPSVRTFKLDNKWWRLHAPATFLHIALCFLPWGSIVLIHTLFVQFCKCLIARVPNTNQLHIWNTKHKIFNVCKEPEQMEAPWCRGTSTSRPHGAPPNPSFQWWSGGGVSTAERAARWRRR